MDATAIGSWQPASRRRRALAIYLDYLLLGPPIAVVLWACRTVFPWVAVLWLPLQLALFLLLEWLLLGIVRFSPGRKALGIETRTGLRDPIHPEAPRGLPVVNPWLLAHERWWTILLGVLLVLDGAKMMVRWTQWSRTTPFFGALLEGEAAAAFQVALGVVETAAGVGLLRLRPWGPSLGIAYTVVTLLSFATSGAVLPEHVEREIVERRAAQGREVRPDEIRLAQAVVPGMTLASGALLLLWLLPVTGRVRSAWRAVDTGRSAPMLSSGT